MRFINSPAGEILLAVATTPYKVVITTVDFVVLKDRHLGVRDHGNEAQGGRILPFSDFCRELHLP
jgi:hypothetical protein